MSDPIPGIEDLVRELRRQGRAAVAAQAAAESCLARVDALQTPDQDDLLRRLLPFADALDRAAEHAVAELARSRPWYARWRTTDSVLEGLALLKAQWAATLEASGITIERRVNVPVDGAIHRVVDVRSPRAGERSGIVVGIQRAGYARDGRCIREADVVATK